MKKQITDIELMVLPFGSIVEVEWKSKTEHDNNEKYRGVIFSNKIGYEDGKIDPIRTIAESAYLGLCTVYLEVNEHDQEV